MSTEAHDAATGTSRGADTGCIYGLNTHQHDPWRASSLAWRTGDNNGLLGSLQPVDLLFEFGDLLNAEISEKQAANQVPAHHRQVAARQGPRRLPVRATPINETLVHELAGGGFIAEQRNAVLVGGTGTGKTHLAIAIARSCIRGGARGRSYNVVDLVNRLETEARAGRQGRRADHLTRLDFVILDRADNRGRPRHVIEPLGHVAALQQH